MVKNEYHVFLSSTVRFLHEVQERQMTWHWSAQSPVFDAVVWMQGLWASRQAVGYSPLFISSLIPFSVAQSYILLPEIRIDLAAIEKRSSLDTGKP